MAGIDGSSGNRRVVLAADDELRADRARARELTFIQTWYGGCYEGTRDQLIAAGVMCAGEFPGEPGRAVYARDCGDGRRIHRLNYRRGRSVDERTRFSVMVSKKAFPAVGARHTDFARFLARALEDLSKGAAHG
jgi:hypothetical protein